MKFFNNLEDDAMEDRKKTSGSSKLNDHARRLEACTASALQVATLSNVKSGAYATLEQAESDVAAVEAEHQRSAPKARRSPLDITTNFGVDVITSAAPVVEVEWRDGDFVPVAQDSTTKKVPK